MSRGMALAGRVGFGVAAMLVAAAGAVGQVEYRYDNGSMSTAVGPPASFPQNPETMWGNYYVAEPGAEVITRVSVALGATFAAGREIRLWIFDDPDNDNDPRNAVLRRMVEVVPTTLGGSTFNHFDIEPTEVSGGFFVAVSAFTERGIDRPAAMDSSGRNDRSWLVYNPATVGINSDNMGANAFIAPVVGTVPFPGAWMVRATGVPTPGAGLVLGAGACMAARRRRR